MQTVTIVDYGMGNLFSVKRALEQIKVPSLITSDAEQILKADKLILPGVGHFAKAMENLGALNLIDSLNEAVLIKQTPILGICLGMQLMAENSEEGGVKGFGWFKASVKKLCVKDTLKYKIPHVSWNTLQASKQSKLLENIDLSSEFYFVHSFQVKLNDPTDELTSTVYEESFTSSIEKKNIFGVQFHPEKSYDAGQQMLKNFNNI